MYYRVTATEGYNKYINARAFYEAETESGALESFARDFPDWANPPEEEDRAVKVDLDPAQAGRDFLGYCTKCGKPAVWRFNYGEPGGIPGLCLRLCAKCYKPKNHRPIVKLAFAASGCKKHNRQWWLHG